MYSSFKIDVLAALSDLDPAILSRVSVALDAASVKYSITETGAALAVVGREEFKQAAMSYIITKRTEGMSPLTISNTARMLDLFILGMNKPIGEVRTNDIRAYLYRYQEQRKISNRTLESMRSKICTFLRWCAAEGYIEKDPSANMKPIKYVAKPRRALSQFELEKVRRACRDDRETAIIETLYSTGCRVSELCSIKLSDVDFEKREITVLGKGGKYRRVYLNAKALVALQVYLSGRKQPDEMLIASKKAGRQLHKGGIEEIFRRISQETGIEVSPHIMRHTMATQALTGTGVEVVQKMLGHANIATTMIYAEVNQSGIHTAHEKCII